MDRLTRNSKHDNFFSNIIAKSAANAISHNSDNQAHRFLSLSSIMSKNKAFHRIVLVLAILSFLPNTTVYAANGFPWGSKPSMSEEELKLSHGTSDVIIDESELNNTPPADYSIDQSVQKDASEGAYLNYFPDDEIQTVKISIDEINLNYLFQNADDSPTVMTESVTIGDTTLGYAGLKTKGNYTLAHTYSDELDSDRFSFTVNFGKYIKKADYGKTQNFYGVQKISFNNFFFDKSLMKEYVSLKLMTEMGIPTPAYALARLYINDEYYGVYFMVEAMDESILERFYNVDDDQLSDYLVKVEYTSFDYEELSEDPSPLYNSDSDTYEDVKDMLPTVLEWDQKLCALSSGTDFDGNEIDVNSQEYLDLLATVIDIDEEVRYFAAHSYLVQLDDMFVEYHNFGLYVDENGISKLIPWDYDLAYGCYFPSTSEATANYDIDVMYKPGPNNNTENVYKNFPLFNVIYQNEELREKYHEYMKDCAIISALGGTTSFGTTYSPVWMNSFIEALSQDLITAAGEELAEHVSYLNGANQPKDVTAALPNLSAIIAKRAVGVYLQVEGIDSTVSGAGCNLGTLGNATVGSSSTKGTLTAVDTDTCWFTTATYADDNVAILLTIDQITEETESYEEIASILKNAKINAQDCYIYSYKCNKTTTENVTLTIPVPEDIDTDTLSVYAVKDGSVTLLEPVSVDGSLYSVIVDSPDYVVLKKVATNDLAAAVILIAVLSGVILLITILVFIKKRRA